MPSVVCLSAEGEQKVLLDIGRRPQGKASFPGLSASHRSQMRWNLSILTSLEFFLLLTPRTVAFLTLKRCEPWKEKPSDFKGRAVLGLSQVMSHERGWWRANGSFLRAWDHARGPRADLWMQLRRCARPCCWGVLSRGGNQTSRGLQDHLEWSQMENLGSPFAARSPDAALAPLRGWAGAFFAVQPFPNIFGGTACQEGGLPSPGHQSHHTLLSKQGHLRYRNQYLKRAGGRRGPSFQMIITASHSLSSSFNHNKLLIIFGMVFIWHFHCGANLIFFFF